MSRPLGKIFTNNTVFTSEGFCLIYFSTRPKLPVLCAIFYISPTECKWLCWGKKTKTSSAGLGPDSGADICEALLSVGVVAAFRRWQPCHRRRSALLTLKQNSGSRPDMASRACAQGWSKRDGRHSATRFRTAVRFHCWTFQRRFLVRSDKLVLLFTPHFPLWNGLPWIS